MVINSDPIEDIFKDVSTNNSIIILDGDDSSDEFQCKMIKLLPAPDTANHDMDVENYNFNIEESQVGLEDVEHDLVINSPAASQVQSQVSANVIFYNFTLMPDEQELVVVEEFTTKPQIHPQCSVLGKYTTQALPIGTNDKNTFHSVVVPAFYTFMGIQNMP